MICDEVDFLELKSVTDEKDSCAVETQSQPS
jgi:hypothetical protein